MPALDEMDDNSLLKPFLVENKAEVKRMCITEYDEERTMAEKISEGEHKRAVTVALTMLKNGESVEKTNLYSVLTIEEVIALSKQVKIVPV